MHCWDSGLQIADLGAFDVQNQRCNSAEAARRADERLYIQTAAEGCFCLQ